MLWPDPGPLISNGRELSFGEENSLQIRGSRSDIEKFGTARASRLVLRHPPEVQFTRRTDRISSTNTVSTRLRLGGRRQEGARGARLLATNSLRRDKHARACQLSMLTSGDKRVDSKYSPEDFRHPGHPISLRDAGKAERANRSPHKTALTSRGRCVGESTPKYFSSIVPDSTKPSCYTKPLLTRSSLAQLRGVGVMRNRAFFSSTPWREDFAPRRAGGRIIVRSAP